MPRGNGQKAFYLGSRGASVRSYLQFGNMPWRCAHHDAPGCPPSNAACMAASMGTCIFCVPSPGYSF
eukprot:365177-Chlamydomonas_euryale.AAC.5